MLDSTEDADWQAALVAARAGDDAARNRLFAACRSYVMLAARVHLQRRLRRKVDPSDLVQQSMLEAHRGFDGFTGDTPGEWLGWLKRIVVHNAADVADHYLGTQQRDVAREHSWGGTDSHSAPPPAAGVDPSPSPSQLVAGREEALVLAERIEGLPEDYRTVIVLRNLERLPFEEIATRMGRSRGACQMLWQRALERLREELETR